MTSFEIVPHELSSIVRPSSVLDRGTPPSRSKLENWPVVYTLNNDNEIYIGETRNAVARLRQHHQHQEKRRLSQVQVIIDDDFNKSAALDLESFLIRLFAGDGKFSVLNRNEGIVDSDYFNRIHYLERFDEIFEELRHRNFFTRSIQEIRNLDLYKLSPFKAPTNDQAIIGSEIVERLLEDLESGQESTAVIQGKAGTGKTVLAIYLIKLLRDIERHDNDEVRSNDTIFSEFFTDAHRQLLAGFKIGLVIPQQSLRESVTKVFRNTPDLDATMILSPFQVGEAEDDFDLLIVDEAHRLNHRANQPSAAQNKRFQSINEALFGEDRPELTQLDWIERRSRHRILLMDDAQAVRPADIRTEIVRDLVDRATAAHRYYELETQMRVRAGSDYLGFVRDLLKGARTEPSSPDFGEYELGMVSDLQSMVKLIRERERKFGLSRLVAGYAWRWKSKGDKQAFDIEEDGVQLRWNSTATDWINSKSSLEEVGSIHTVQGYDLNYAGVIIGRDLRLDPDTKTVYFDRSHYFDVKGKENNPKLGISYSDDDILTYVQNIYAVLMSRGIRGTFLYVCDEPLREYFQEHLPTIDASVTGERRPGVENVTVYDLSHGVGGVAEIDLVETDEIVRDPIEERS
ncbi:MAG: DNA/RNA helicase domain-containing protein [Micrococcaceae bacterium]